MKRRILLVLLLCVMGVTTLTIGNANAAGWYTCSISQTGAGWGQNYIVVTDSGGVFTNRYFVLDDSVGKAKEMYAAALTAISNASNVTIYVNDTTSQYAACYGLLLIK